MSKEIVERAEIIEGIEELEDYIERLVASNKLSYDESFHQYLIQNHAQLVTKIKNSSLNDEDKGFMTETIAELFKEHIENTNISIDTR